MFAFSLGVLILIVIAWGLAIHFNRRFEETIASAIFLIIGLLYIFGLFGNLNIGLYAVYLLSIFLGVWTGLILYKKRSIQIFDQLLTPGFAVFIVFFLIIFWGTHGRMLYYWDEFSHWGLVTKNMYTLNAFGNVSGATTHFQGYPPAASLFQYFFIKLSNPLIESLMFCAMDVFLVSLMLCVFKNIDWKTALLVALLLFVFPLVFYSDFYTSVYVDALLGMVFAHILYTYFSELSPNKNTMIHIGISIFILTLIKASGAGLAIIAVAIIGVDVIRKNHFKQGILFLLIPLLCLCIGKFSWDVYLKITGTSEAWDMSNLSAAGLLGLFNGTAPSYFKDVILSFANRFFEFHGQGALQLSYFNWTIILILLAAVGFQFFSPNSEKARTKIYTTGVVLGFCAYLFSLLILYLFTYSEYEAINLNSYDRYVSTYILGAVAFFILMILDVSLKKSSRSTNRITWIILCVLTILLPFQLLLRFCIIPMVDNGITREYRAAMQYSESFADFWIPKLIVSI